MANVIAWLLRLTAWGLIVGFTVRLMLDYRLADLTGRLHQAHVRLESDVAAGALLKQTGLDRTFDPVRYDLQVSLAPGKGLPTWLGITDRTAPDFLDATVWVLLDERGGILLPALENPLRSGFEWKSSPDAIKLVGRGGDAQWGAICMLGSKSGAKEWTVWLHRDAGWTNVLRLTHSGPMASLDLKPVPDAEAARGVELNVPPILRWTWDAARNSFDSQTSFTSPITPLELLPDQPFRAIAPGDLDAPRH